MCSLWILFSKMEEDLVPKLKKERTIRLLIALLEIWVPTVFLLVKERLHLQILHMKAQDSPYLAVLGHCANIFMLMWIITERLENTMGWFLVKYITRVLVV